MAICIYCGATVPDGLNHCTNCGNPTNSASYTEQQSVNYSLTYQQPQYQQQMYTQNLQEMAPVPSTGTFIGWFFLASIPLVGLILSIVFAADSSSKVRSHFFGGMLLFKLILVLIVVLLYFMLGASIFYFINNGIYY